MPIDPPVYMQAAGLPLSDGVAELLSAAGLRHSFEEVDLVSQKGSQSNFTCTCTCACTRHAYTVHTHHAHAGVAPPRHLHGSP